MIYYTSDLREIHFTNKQEPIGSGLQGAVYAFDRDKCIKIYKEDVFKYSKEIFMLLKELSLEGYCQLYDLLYSAIDQQEIVAYTMKKYISEVDNILNMPTEYTLHSFNTLYNSIKTLAENSIIVRDTIAPNAILTKEGIILIDMDSYRKSTLPKGQILEVNINNILYLFRRLFEEGLKKMDIDIQDDELTNYLDAIFAYSKEPVKALKRRMDYSKTPMDILPYKYRY